MRHTRTGAFAQYRLSSLHRNASPIAQAAAILARYGGSLWVADPAYTFTGSDGTGAAGDGSDAGYVRDLCGNARPLTQATTSFKPKLRLLSGRWAWVFDGTDDTLATVAQPSVASETLVVAKQVNVLPTSGGTAITRWATPANTGSLLYANTSSATAMRVGTGTALTYLTTNNPVLVPVVQSGVFSAQSRHRINGVQSAVNNAGFTSNATPINVGGYAGLFVNQNIYAAAYAPAAIPDAGLLTIEKAMAQLAGVTI